MKVSVYVEGPSDQSALTALLKPIIEAGRARGVGIRFYPQGGKASLLRDVPRKAAELLKQSPDDWVFALPDLYPMASFEATDPHRSFDQLEALLRERFVSRADKIGLTDAVRSHFRVHCLKHDLEALLLASPDELRQRLRTTDGLRRLPRRVEDQNDHNPPKYVVDALFQRYLKKRYIDTLDAPWILERANLPSIEAACPQFARFVREQRALSEGRDPDATEVAGSAPPGG